MAAPKNRFVNVHLNIDSLDIENKNAAGTAHETVGQPGTQIPIAAKIINRIPRPMYTLLFAGLLATQYLSTIASIESNRSPIQTRRIMLF